MGKIVKPPQPKHKETLSPWLKEYVAKVANAPLPEIPQLLAEFPITWPFSRGDLYHWIPLLNRFDNILECFCATYRLTEGPQSRDFTCELLLKQAGSLEYHDDKAWTQADIEKLGYGGDGDSQLVVAILKFSTKLLDHCGNRSIYSSSAHLSDLLHTTSLSVLQATLDVSKELAKRYYASVKRINGPSVRHVGATLLASHYNIDLERVHQLSQPFVKTPAVSSTAEALPPATSVTPSVKGKEKAQSAMPKNVASMYANDLVSLATSRPQEDSPSSGWDGWGDVKVNYYPDLARQPLVSSHHPSHERPHAAMPSTPTPLRRSSTMGPPHRSPRTDRHSADDTLSGSQPTMGFGIDEVVANSLHRTLEIPQEAVSSRPIYELLALCPEDMPKSSRYEVLNRLRVAKALLGSEATRQQALAVRLLAISNLSYIHPEATFVEKLLKHDNDEPRRYQLVYQLAELVHPVTHGASDIPLWIQAIAFQLLEAIVSFPAKQPDVLSALNANVNHGVLLYVIRKAVAGMREPEEQMSVEQRIEADVWRASLFSLTSHMCVTVRLGTDMVGAGILENLVEILKIRSSVADRHHSMILNFLDGLIYNYQGAFQAFVDVKGLDVISDLTVYVVKKATDLVEAGQGMSPDHRSSIVDYEIPYYQQQTLKWLLKFIHHVMTSWFSFGGNTDRLLRNIVDNSALLRSIRHITEDMTRFGSVVWTNSVTILSDFINNDPTSFAALMEAGLIKSFLESLTGRQLPDEEPGAQPQSIHDADGNGEGEHGGEDAPSPDSYGYSSSAEQSLGAPRDGPLARGTLASSEAMAIIPSVLNSICLNNVGLKMVVSSGAFSSYLEIFESPTHVAVLDNDPTELAATIGSSFDELARHHPTIKNPIARAVMGMVTRVVQLGKEKAEKQGWGVSLSVPHPAGGSILANEVLPDKLGMALAVDQDTEMSTDGPDSESSGSDGAPSRKGMTIFVAATANFLSNYIGNASLKALFIRKGGIELLLDLSESPSLPHDFAESEHSKTLQHVVSSMVETLPIYGLPSLLNRTQAALDTLSPLLTHNGPEPFFAPFVRSDLSLRNESGEWDQDIIKRVASGTQVARALLRTESLLKTIHECYVSRGQLVNFHPVNVYDHYARLAKALGPLLRVVLSEDMALSRAVPSNWHHSGSVAPLPSQAPDIPAGNGAQSAVNQGDPAPSIQPGDSTAAPDTTSGSLNARPVDAAAAAAPGQNLPSAPETKSLAYRNYQVLQGLLHDLMPTAYFFFQCTGRALLPRREKDLWLRAQHLWLAEVLADTALEQMKGGSELDPKDLNYWTLLLHSIDQLLTNKPPQSDRGTYQPIIPVLVAFKDRGGFDSLHSVLLQLSEEVCKERTDPSDSRSRLAQAGMKKILDLYLKVVTGKNIMEAVGQVNLAPRPEQRRDYNPIGHQLLVELRMSILQVVRNLWDSKLVEKGDDSVISRIVEIIKAICSGDNEQHSYSRKDKNSQPPAVLKREVVLFDWNAAQPVILRLTDAATARADEEALKEQKAETALIREAVFRANGLEEMAADYIQAVKSGYVRTRNPVPDTDAFKETAVADPEARPSDASLPAPQPASEADQSSAPTPLVSGGGDAMVIDSNSELDRPVSQGLMTGLAFTTASADSNDNDDDTPSRTSDGRDASSSSSRPVSATANPTDAQASAAPLTAAPSVSREDLDEERTKLRDALIDRCLDVIRSHSASVYEVSELISTAILQNRGGNDESRQEVGETLANALMSFAIDDDNKKANAPSIAAYAHLLSMLLQDAKFFRATVNTLKDNISEYLGFLKLSPDSSSEELPQWISYILLIFEILLIDDEQPVEAKWAIPSAEGDEIKSLELQEKEPILSVEYRKELLDTILELLARVGKNEGLAVAVLRMLVILTRDREFAKVIGEKKHLGRLFMMIKQLSGLGSGRFKETKISSYILMILRHVIEDDDTIRQMMRFEIRNYFETPQRSSSRSADLQNYLRVLGHVALRSPKIFIATTEEMVKLQRWTFDTAEGQGQSRPFALMLKESVTKSDPVSQASDLPKDDSVEPTVQATEELNINEVKPSTESADKEMTDAPKMIGSEFKRPIVENPDGVVNFLLEQLLNYQKVEDTDPNAVPLAKDKPKDSASPSIVIATPVAASGEASSPSSAPSLPGPPAESKEKKSPLKQTFKAEDHPIFIYRCFILHCLSELLQGYNRAKIEFINFKRGAPMLTNTPVKPRSSVLNYLLNDLLCLKSLQSPSDPLAFRKKVSTSEHARLVLVALVSKTGERWADNHVPRYEPSDEADLVFVRKFVLDTVLRAYREVSTSSDAFDVRYAKMMSLAELMFHMIDDKEAKDMDRGTSRTSPDLLRSHAQIKRMMYEKGYLAALTASIADIDLTFPGVKRTIKYILRVLRFLTQTASVLSQENVLPPSADNHDDEILSASSLSDLEDEREETPDLYRNSALGMLEPREEDDFSEESQDEDEEMYDDGYDEELEYDEDMSQDGEENVSDDDEELGGMGHIEGLSGDPGVVEVIMGEDDDDESMDDDDDDDDDEDESSDEDDDEDDDDDDADSNDIEEVEERIEIVDGEGNAIEDDGASDWESESENGDDEEELDFADNAARDVVRAAMDANRLPELPDLLEGFPPMGDRYIEEEDIDDDDEEPDDDLDEDIFIYDRDNMVDEPMAPMDMGLGWDSPAAIDHGATYHRHRGGVRRPYPVAPAVVIGNGSQGEQLHNTRPEGGRTNRNMRRSRRHLDHMEQIDHFVSILDRELANSPSEFRNYFRSRGAPPANAAVDDGMNPLLRRHRAAPPEQLHRSSLGGPFRMPFSSSLFGGLNDPPYALIHDLIHNLPSMGGRGGHPLQFIAGGPRGDVHEVHISFQGGHAPVSHSENRREVYHEPQHAVSFTTLSTAERWQEESRMIFGGAGHVDKAAKFFNIILSKLAPPAIAEAQEQKRKKREQEEERRKREEEARKQEAEAKATREKEEAEKKAKEAAEAAEAAAAASAAAAAASAIESGSAKDAAGEDHGATADPQPMEGVEQTEAVQTGTGAQVAESTAADTSQERVVTTIRGEEVDITGLGIDPEYLAALPEEFREEVIAQTLTTRRSEARQQAETTGEQTEAFNEFLDALPEELRQEIMQQEAQERRRREREEERRRANNANAPQEMDAASILLTFDQALREEILQSQHEELADHLPPEMLSQARALVAERNRAVPRLREDGRHRQVNDEAVAPPVDNKPQRRPCVQMLDKAGVATLLRLMFTSQHSNNIRSHLFAVLLDVCENRQNRLEVISTLLQILQDGSTDMHAVERSFGQLSLKAKQPKDKEKDQQLLSQQKTPGSIKRASTTVTPGAGGNSTTPMQGNSEISPLLIVQQCLDLLVELCRNPHIPSLFLTEHETVGSSLRRHLSRKGKGKDLKSTKYAINSLLSLLGRDLVMDSSAVMQLLADLLNKVTYPLQALERRRREAEEEEKKAAEAAASASSTSAGPNDQEAPAADTAGAAPTESQTDPATTPPDNRQPDNVQGAGSQDVEAEGSSKAQGGQISEIKKSKQLQPPVIPLQSLTLVVNIFVARECSSKTFQNTISTIKNLSNIPGAKAVFGQELVRQARVLSENIVADLDDLLPHIVKAESGTEIQGVALAKFSPGASEQNKLLRVLTALDHLFETRGKKSGADNGSEKEEYISSLYHTPTFTTMWEKLSACLSAIHKRENMVNVATILLPLIESLMVVCKNTTLSEASVPAAALSAKEMLLSSPPPEDRMAGLFFTFTEEHRRVLNELVRNNPKLMSGTFSLLVKNPKVLEFDNKRNYFNRSVHSKTGSQSRPSFPPLQLAVRRDHVFHDSFKSLYFKKGEEMKYGKLNIRFHGEEGVDAGGVTREWFQVLSRQMFNPDYVLFTPVSSDRTTFHPNKLSSINDEHLMFFKFIGRIIGKALYEGRVLDCYFSRAVYKRILGKSVSVKDMESFDPEYYKSLVWMLENDITDIITETFAVESEAFGATRTVDLLENGRNVPVTNENKHDYVRLVVEHKLLASVQEQMAEFLQGFHDIIPAELIAIFNEQELELLISGLPDIDVDDWKGHTDYHNYTAASQQIQWFWRAVRSFDKEERAKLLQFVTGTSKVPLNGFKDLEGMNGVSRFNIHRDYGNKDRLPSSHTCFNQLDLPEYESYDHLRSQIIKAITTGSDYFGFA